MGEVGGWEEPKMGGLELKLEVLLAAAVRGWGGCESRVRS